MCPSDDAKASKGCAGKYYILLTGAGLALIIICKSYLYIFFTMATFIYYEDFYHSLYKNNIHCNNTQQSLVNLYSLAQCFNILRDPV